MNKTTSFLQPIHRPMYGDLAYDEDPHLHCIEPTQHSWVLDPNYIKAQVVMIGKATRLPP